MRQKGLKLRWAFVYYTSLTNTCGNQRCANRTMMRYVRTEEKSGLVSAPRNSGKSEDPWLVSKELSTPSLYFSNIILRPRWWARPARACSQHSSTIMIIWLYDYYSLLMLMTRFSGVGSTNYLVAEMSVFLEPNHFSLGSKSLGPLGSPSNNTVI